MKYESEYYHFSLSNQMIFRRIVTSLAVFIGTFSIVAIFHFDRSETHSRGTFTKIFYGFGNMPFSTYLFTLPIAIFIIIIVLLYINSKYNHLNIIVGIDLNEGSKVLKIRTKTLSDSITDIEMPFANVKIAYNRLTDGLTSSMYDCITVSNNDKIVGHLYQGHHMWTLEDSEKLKKALEGILSSR